MLGVNKPPESVDWDPPRDWPSVAVYLGRAVRSTDVPQLFFQPSQRTVGIQVHGHCSAMAAVTFVGFNGAKLIERDESMVRFACQIHITQLRRQPTKQLKCSVVREVQAR